MAMKLKVLLDADNAGLKTAATQGRKELDGLRKSADKTSDSFEKMRPAILGIAGSLAGAFTIYELTQFADEAGNVRNRLRDITDGAEEFAEAQDRVRKIANESRQSLASTAELYSRMERAAGHLLSGQEELGEVVTTINKAFAVSGASAQEASNAITQLSQGLQSGTLRGDEFNSVAEQAPIVLEAVEKQTGKTRGEIRAMAADGRITADLLITSLQNYAGEVDRRFDQSEATISQFFAVSRNNVVAYISDLDEASGATQVFGQGIVNVSENLDALSDVLIAVVALSGTKYIPAIYAATAAKVALTKASLTATPAVTGLSAAMGVQAARATTATVATNALALSSRALAATLGFLTGPAGLVLLAAGSIAYFATQSSDAKEETEGLTQSLDDAIRKFKELDETSRAIEIDKITVKETESRGKLLAINEELLVLEEKLANAMGAQRLNGGLSNEATSLLPEMQELEEQAKTLTTELDQLTKKKAALFNSTLPDVKAGETASPSGVSDEAGQKRIDALLQQYQTETDMLDAQLQIQQQVRDGAMTEAEGKIYASFVRREQQSRDHFDKIKQDITEYYDKEIELAGTNAVRVAELEQEKNDKLTELRQTHNENTLLMGEEQNALLEQQTLGFLERLKEHMRVSSEDFDAIWGNTFDRFAQGIGDATATAIVEQKNFGDAAKALAKSAIKELISGLIQVGVKYAAMKAIEMTTTSTAAAATTAANVAAATASTAAWTPAAAMASLASFGANAAPAMAGISATVALSKGLALAGIAHDGLGRATSDNEGTYLVRRDEMVLNPRQRENFDAMRKDYERGSGRRQDNQYSFNPTIIINAEGSETGVEEAIKGHVETALAEFDNTLQEDFASNGQRSQLLAGRAA